MKTLFLLLIGILFNFFVQAQSPVGKWKLVSCTQETRDGEKTDLLKDLVKQQPCTATANFNFSADGKITLLADKCPADMQQAVVGIKWKMPAKNKITVLIDEDIDPVTYDFELIGNKMRWTINYDTHDSKDIKQLVTEFIRA